MNQARKLELTLWGLTLLFAAIIAGALLRKPTIAVGPIAPAELGSRAATGTRAGADASEVVDAIVAGNIFSASRAAPRERYAPYGSVAESEAYSQTESFDAGIDEGVPEEGVQSTDEANVPRLFGTTLGPRGATAVIRLDPASPEGRLYREGDRANGYEVLEIHARSVVLSGPKGTIEVRLARPEERTP